MKTSTRNYQELTTALCDIFEDVQSDSVALDKATVLVNVANSITSLQRAKVASTKVTGERKIQFFEES